ncbi:MAG TPA: kelch repeat-containing protein, partial [Pyrinomonadaceae bacterium]|nr:kelch repeat-containing protein [Pyrinomonadaceae bacterium]
MNTENRKTSTSRSARRTILLAIAAMIAISALAAYSAGVSADTIKRFVLSSSAEGGISQTPVSFRSEASSLTAPEPLITTTSGSLLTARSGHTATALDDGRVLITGGDGVGSSEIYDPASGLSVSTGNLNAARSGHTATRLADGRVFISGGTVGGAA